MNYLTQWLSGIGLLIFIYLLLANGGYTVKIVNSLAENTVSGIKTLQGR